MSHPLQQSVNSLYGNQAHTQQALYGNQANGQGLAQALNQAILGQAAWNTFPWRSSELRHTGPTHADLEKYPAVKEAWDEFQVVAKLAGVKL